MKIQRGSDKFIALAAFILLGCLFSCVAADHGGSDDPLDWLRESIPGEPGVDYPILADVEPTSFSCRDRVFGGYYADPEMQCQGYHVCLASQFAPGIADRKMSFLCPNGTVFSQALFTCDWWFNVDCSEAETFYTANEKIGDENARIGDDSEQSGQGRRSQTAQRGSSSNRRKQTNAKGTSAKKPKSRKNSRPSKKQQKKKPAPRPSKPSSGSRRQPNKPNKNGKRKRPSGRRVTQNKAKQVQDGGGSRSPSSNRQRQGSSSQTTGGRKKSQPSLFQSDQRTSEDERPVTVPTFDIVQYDATIPDGDDYLDDLGVGVPLLLAGPFNEISKLAEDDSRKSSTHASPRGPLTQLYAVPPRG